MAYQQVTRDTLRQLMEARWEFVPFWEVEEANSALNEAMRVWNALTAYWQGSQDVTLPADDFQAAVFGSLTRDARVLVGTQALVKVSRQELILIRPNWRQEYTDSGGDVPTSVQWWAPEGLNTIRIWPRPRANVTLTIEGMRTTPVLTDDAQFVDLGEEEMGPLLDETLHICAFKGGGQRWEATKPLHVRFLKAAFDTNQYLQQSVYFRRQLFGDRSRVLASPTRTPQPEPMPDEAP